MTVIISRSRLLDMEAQGYVLVGWAPDWANPLVEMAKPESTCCRPMTTGRCVLKLGHRGRHSTIGFYCDGHGRMVRGTPAQTLYNGDGVPDVTLCFLCVRGILP